MFDSVGHGHLEQLWTTISVLDELHKFWNLDLGEGDVGYYNVPDQMIYPSLVIKWLLGICSVSTFDAC
jgi:hypothetical protein